LSAEPKQNGLSERACQLLGLLLTWRERMGVGVPVTDDILGHRLGTHPRNVINIAGELLAAGHLILASCDNWAGGRYLLRPGDDLRPAYEHRDALRKRARKILLRRRNLIRAIRRAEALHEPETDGQLHLHGEHGPLARNRQSAISNPQATTAPRGRLDTALCASPGRPVGPVNTGDLVG